MPSNISASTLHYLNHDMENHFVDGVGVWFFLECVYPNSVWKRMCWYTIPHDLHHHRRPVLHRRLTRTRWAGPVRFLVEPYGPYPSEAGVGRPGRLRLTGLPKYHTYLGKDTAAGPS